MWDAVLQSWLGHDPPGVAVFEGPHGYLIVQRRGDSIALLAAGIDPKSIIVQTDVSAEDLGRFAQELGELDDWRRTGMGADRMAIDFAAAGISATASRGDSAVRLEATGNGYLALELSAARARALARDLRELAGP
jgi:hypothetical protein